MRTRIESWWFAAIPALIGVILAVWGVGRPAPWLDELFTLRAVSHGLAEHLFEMPLIPYYFVAWLWSGAGHVMSVEWLRILSGLSIAAGSIAVALTGRRVADAKVGFAAALFFVIAPGIGRYGQEARGYAMAAALAALATFALVSALSTPSRRWWILYGIALGVGGLVLPTTWAIVPAHVVIMWGYPDVRRHATDGLAVLLFLTPVIALDVFLGMQFGHLHDWLAEPTIGDLPSGLLMPVSSEYTRAAVPLALVVLSLFSTIGRRWLLGVAASVLVVWCASFVLGSWWTARSFLPLAVLLCVAGAASLREIAWPITGVLLGLIVVLATPDHVAIRQEGSRGVDVRVIASIIQSHGEPGDRLQVAGNFPLDWVYSLYLRRDPRGFAIVTAPPSRGRYWELSPDPTCSRFIEWPTITGVRVRLCD